MNIRRVEEDMFVLCPLDEQNTEIPAQVIYINDDKQAAYVHFLNNDKRLDKWKPLTDLKPYVPSEEEKEPVIEGDTLDPKTNFIEFFEYRHQQATSLKNIDRIMIGKYELQTWYHSPFIEEFERDKIIFFCSHCAAYFHTKEQLREHEGRCCHPQGREIYRKDNISIFEVYGNEYRFQCQCICLLGKLFLDHKIICYYVEDFKFYILTVYEDGAIHIAGFFSKELESVEDNILSCIIVFPHFQSHGFGKLLISCAYELAKRENTFGGPERPLSDLGEVAFKSYWKEEILMHFNNQNNRITNMSQLLYLTHFKEDELWETVNELGILYVDYEDRLQQFNMNKVKNLINETNLDKKRIDPKFLIYYPNKKIIEDSAESDAEYKNSDKSTNTGENEDKNGEEDMSEEEECINEEEGINEDINKGESTEQKEEMNEEESTEQKEDIKDEESTDKKESVNEYSYDYEYEYEYEEEKDEMENKLL